MAAISSPSSVSASASTFLSSKASYSSTSSSSEAIPNILFFIIPIILEIVSLSALSSDWISSMECISYPYSSIIIVCTLDKDLILSETESYALKSLNILELSLIMPNNSSSSLIRLYSYTQLSSILIVESSIRPNIYTDTLVAICRIIFLSTLMLSRFMHISIIALGEILL